MELWQIEKFLCVFGDCIKWIQFEAVRLDEYDIRLCLMVEHSKAITKLECRVCPFVTIRYQKPINAIIPMLEELSIFVKERMSGFTNFFSQNMRYRLKALNISSRCFFLPVKRLPQLENLILSNNSGLSPEYALPFFSLNPQIKSLKLENICLLFDNSRILNYLPNLVELQLFYVR